ncbi:nucleoid protein Hbs [Alkalibaculum bacchi]|uniref:Nucleoid protein Hbs n=1 Tax=Alkalibaculum bacchi TaxID=645887 RepID=A0A366IBJ7_9FIRM|nr:HU family DNA-binding protein [Alkalibaculum bacchi]RBP67461.1 nucleoid protein Hbs [Alkalibaculum bacchi]
MNKAELVAALTEKTGLAKKDNEKVLNSLIETIIEELQNGEKISLVGFGTFEVRDRAERMGRNPKTMEELLIPASKAPTFKAGKALKDAVNNK